MQEAGPRTLIVMPAFNEQESVYRVVREVLDGLGPSFDCLVVDDGSRDGTASEARRAGALVARLPFNLGVGGALRTGLRYAREQGYAAAVQVDADGQHDAQYVPGLIAALSEADLVIGARFAGTGDYAVRGPRRWAMKMLSGGIFLMTKVRLSDTTSGFKAYGSRAIEVLAENLPAEYLGDTVEALVIAARAGCRIVQIPVAMRERTTGRPSAGPLASAKYLARVIMAMAVASIKPVRVHP
jgi:glycosyltransferase involved in cell wall biosynthesis